MASTLTEAAKYTNDMLRKGVLEEIVKDSPVLQRMKWIDVVGNAYAYLRERTQPTADFYAPGDVWSENTGDVYRVTATITILGGDADTDNFIQATRSDKTDIEAENIQAKAKATKHTYLDRFYYGNSAVSTKEFDGLHRMILTGGEGATELVNQSIHEGAAATGSGLNVSNLDLMITKRIRDGKPDILLMSPEIQIKLTQYVRGKANLFTTKRDSYGDELMHWNNVALVYDDFLLQTEAIASGTYSAKTGGATSSIFAVRFGTKDLLGLQNGALTTKDIGQLESKDATRHRIKWYVGMALLRTIGIGIIDGITDVAVAD